MELRGPYQAIVDAFMGEKSQLDSLANHSTVFTGDGVYFKAFDLDRRGNPLDAHRQSP